MKTSANGRAFIESFEGKFNHTYDDGTGVLTIGFGHTTEAGPPAVYRGMTITDAECDAILAADLASVERDVNSILPGLSQCQFDAMVSFHFNTGKLASSSIPAKLKAGNVNAAMETLLAYNRAGGNVMRGLTRRRAAEREMFLGNVAQAMKIAGATLREDVPAAPPKPVIIQPKPDIPPPPVKPSVTNPAPGSLGAWIVTLLKALFGKKP